MLRSVTKSIMVIYKNDRILHVAEEGGDHNIIAKNVGCEGWLWTAVTQENALRWLQNFGFYSHSLKYIHCSRVKADSHTACRSHAVPLPCRALIHTCHAAPLPYSDSAVSFVNVRIVAGNIRTASPTV